MANGKGLTFLGNAKNLVFTYFSCFNGKRQKVFRICQEPYLLFKYSNNLYSCDEIIIACDFNISNCS